MAFEDVERVWVDQLDKLRNVVRQELITRQLAPYADDGCSVLDVGCGQGTQALRLATRGCHVTGVDQSADLLRRFRTDAQVAGHSVESYEGTLADLAEQRFLGPRDRCIPGRHRRPRNVGKRHPAPRVGWAARQPGGRLGIAGQPPN